jgi:hypothetical protein
MVANQVVKLNVLGVEEEDEAEFGACKSLL